MTHDDQFHTPPDHWSTLVPEMLVTDLPRSRSFYCDLIGFTEKFGRPEDGFLYLEMGHAQIMLEAISDDRKQAWITGPLQAPFGRGLNLQIEIPDVQSIYARVLAAGITPYRQIRASWYREGAHENGQNEFLVQDPDGYLLRFVQHLGARPVADR
ncbi:bleomycin resistance protein [Halocynthiibacter namhaensis]|uniref:bleomycin resistance protein n=1 Tax=Halocynthiibacter namhaensis TaxID=1290553 RepID=UPI0006903974|nr:VOC family protein [Halocynthiibacter namhaensis]